MISKFRAWDIDGEQMLYTEEDLVVEFFDEGVVITDHTTFSSSCMDIDNFELMQSTGLKDINDKEIYEGDIVNVHEFTMGGSYDGAIELDTLYINAVITYNKLKENGFYEWCIKTKDFEFPINSLDGLHEESFDVVGNIFQNANLLEADSHE